MSVSVNTVQYNEKITSHQTAAGCSVKAGALRLGGGNFCVGWRLCRMEGVDHAFAESQASCGSFHAGASAPDNELHYHDSKYKSRAGQHPGRYGSYCAFLRYSTCAPIRSRRVTLSASITATGGLIVHSCWCRRRNMLRSS